jgi:hypothetical protein
MKITFRSRNYVHVLQYSDQYQIVKSVNLIAFKSLLENKIVSAANTLFPSRGLELLWLDPLWLDPLWLDPLWLRTYNSLAGDEDMYTLAAVIYLQSPKNLPCRWSANAKFRMEYTAKKLPDQSILETLMTDLLGEDRQVNKSLMVDNGQNGMVLYATCRCCDCSCCSNGC